MTHTTETTGEQVTSRTRKQIAAETVMGCSAGSLSAHQKIADAILAGKSTDEILALCDDWPETYAWLKMELAAIVPPVKDITLYADTVNGVMRTGDDEHIKPENDIDDESIFFDLLAIEDEYIVCRKVSPAMVKQIEQVYGIRG
jgi:disulfide oxidoreductase YuzD